MPGLEIRQKILLKCGANLQARARYLLGNLVEKVNAGEVDSTALFARLGKYLMAFENVTPEAPRGG